MALPHEIALCFYHGAKRTASGTGTTQVVGHRATLLSEILVLCLLNFARYESLISAALESLAVARASRA